jgi:ribosomal-protein-serine acetyltransferase
LIDLGGGASLRELTADDAPALIAAIEKDRVRYDRWLRWTPLLRSAADAAALIAELPPKGGFHLGLFLEGELSGGVICWKIHPHHRSSEVGYWLAESALGRGLATRAAGAMVSLLFRERTVHRIEMLTSEANLRSRAVCERLGFRLEASRRGSHRIAGGFDDHLVYARLVTDVVPDDPPRRLLTADEFRALLERLGAAWRARDYASAASCFTEDVSYGDPTRYALHGRSALRGFFEDDADREQILAWHTIVFDPAQQVGAAEYTYEGTHRYHGAVFARVANGLIAHWREHQHVDDGRSWEEFAGGLL